MGGHPPATHESAFSIGVGNLSMRDLNTAKRLADQLFIAAT
jgi:hypothetical protein